jgi:hypothetical protein
MNGFTVCFSLTKNKYKSTHKACPSRVYCMLDAWLKLNFPEEKAL